MFGQPSLSGNKPICQFYQMGNCKYGSSCYNLHPGASGTGTAAANVFGGNSSNALQDNQFTEFVKQVITEMKMWESSGLWQLSCLAPLKEHPPIAEFVDTSSEELRVEAYEAHKANNSAAYQTSLNSKYEYQKQLRDALKNHSPDALEVLKNVYYKTIGGATLATSSTSLFGKSSGSFLGGSSTQSSSLFGGAASGSKPPVFGGSTNQGTSNVFGVKPQTSIFGAPPVFGASPFGGSNTFKSTFGSTQSSGIFGSSANSEASQNVFNKSQNQGLFGGVSSGSTGIFGSANTSSSNNLFGANANTNKTSIFGANSSTSGSSGVFGTIASSDTSSVFGTNTSTGTNSIFGTNADTGSNNIFGTNTNVSGSNSIFGSGTNTSGSDGIFGAAPTTSSSNSIFGSSTNNSGSGGIFGATPTAPSSNSIFGVNTQVSGSSIFGTSTTNTTTTSSLFSTNTSTSGSSSLFGPNTSTTGSGIFGTNNTGVIAPNQNTSVFGSTVAQQGFGAAPVFGQNLFNKNQGNSTIFGSGSSNQTVQSSILGSPPQTKDNQTRLFGGGTTTSNTVFGGGNANQASNGGIFDNVKLNEQNQVSSSSSVFGNNFGTGVSTADNTNFVSSNQNIYTGKSMFSENTNGNNYATVSVVSAPTSISDIKPPDNSNLSGTGIPSSTVSSTVISGTSTTASIRDLIYTPMHLLSIEDKTEFEKDVFLRIPMIPPPKELCF